MDIRNEKNHVFNIRLAKLLGLYQMLDPGTIKFLGRNVYQMFVGFFVLYLAVISMALFVDCLRLWTYDTSVSILDLLLAINSFYACCKMSLIIYRSNDIWDCLSITWYGFTSSSFRKRTGHDVLDRWRARLNWYTNLIAVAFCFSFVFYIRCHLVFGETIRSIKNLDGTIGNYRWNVLNLSILTSDVTYNEYYNTFFVFEALFIILVTVFYLIFDILLLTLCLATCCQLKLIGDAFKSVHNKSLIDPYSSAIAMVRAPVDFFVL
ncbi:hypothetical protein QTP88_013410 [Uroleucon formosanum]